MPAGKNYNLEWEKPPDIGLQKIQAKYAKQVRYLGVVYSEQLNFEEHAEEKPKQFKQRRRVLRYLAGTS